VQGRAYAPPWRGGMTRRVPYTYAYTHIYVCVRAYVRHRDTCRLPLEWLSLFQAALAPRVDLISSAYRSYACAIETCRRAAAAAAAAAWERIRVVHHKDRVVQIEAGVLLLLRRHRRLTLLCCSSCGFKGNSRTSLLSVFERAENSRQQRTVFAPAAAAAAAAPAPLPTSQAAAVGVRPL
jgi:hypothetical protein